MKTNTKHLMFADPTFTCQRWSTRCQRLRYRLCVVRLLPLLLWAVPDAVEAQYSHTTTTSGAVTIPSTINGLLVTSIGDSLFEGTGLTSVGTPNSETAIAPANTSIPWQQLGGQAGADYKGGGLDFIPTAEGARLRCVFQRLEGEATREGLWLTSTLTNAVNDRFRVTATEVGRFTPNAPKSVAGAENKTSNIQLEKAGTVEVADKLVRFVRPGVIEAYTVSVDGVRQDFIIEQRPAGKGELAVRLAVSGSGVEPTADGAQLVLENSGRRIAYSRLRVTDAMGTELSARMEIQNSADFPVCCIAGFPTRAPFEFDCVADWEIGDTAVLETCATFEPTLFGRAPMLAVVVNDADAVYPVRIDPTFSDANWISMNPSIPGANFPVYAAVVDDSGNLYIGGGFTLVGDVLANRIAKWNGSSWSALGSGMDGEVYALAVSGSDLYAGGFFPTAGGSPAKAIARWNRSSWAALGSGIDGGVLGLAVSGSDVYAGGSFTTASGNTVNNIAKWNGSSWAALGSGIGGTFREVKALAVSGSDVYAAGEFRTAGGSAATNIAKWNGTSWSALGLGMNDTVYALAVSGNDVYAGGYFTTAGGSAANYIAKWNGSSWSALGSGEGGDFPYVKALAVSGSDVYAGGEFTTAGGGAANYIAKWNGSSWSALGSGSGMNSGVSALAVSGSDVYAGGAFTTAGGSAATNIAKWNGRSWSALGSGMDGFVLALAVSGNDVYAGGEFRTAGGSAANSIARWNGSGWSALGSGIDSPPPFDEVLALAVSGSDVYAGGHFTTAGGSAANYIAKWNGSGWSALGSGMDGDVFALAVSGSDVYAAGHFTTAGGSAANNIAKWNGSSWSTLGSGITGGARIFGPYVYALAVSGSDVYAGGTIRTAGDSTGIAKWDGNNWTALGSGIGIGVRPGVSALAALAVSGSDLYAGGGFTTAGGKVSAYIARAYLPTLPMLSVLRSGREVMVFWPSADTAGFALEQAGTLSAPLSWVTNSASVTDDGTSKSVTVPATNSPRFFRLRRP